MPALSMFFGIIVRMQSERGGKHHKAHIHALYGDFEGKFYGFSLKEERIWISTVVYAFLLKYKLEIEKLNYYAWAKLLEKINAHNPPTKLVDKLETI